MKSKKGCLIVISGFAGTGKGTIIKAIRERYGNYELSVSATTRPAREGEEDGIHYFFKTKDEFERMIEENELLEYAQFVGNYYGTPRSFVEQKLSEGRDVILEIEVQGAMQVKKSFPNALLLFIVPPDADSLRRRLVGRGTETAEVIEERLKRSVAEAGYIGQYDYLIVNDELEEAIEETHRTIQYGKNAVIRQSEVIQRLKEDLEEKFTD